jgi:hypothetical protein
LRRSLKLKRNGEKKKKVGAWSNMANIAVGSHADRKLTARTPQDKKQEMQQETRNAGDEIGVRIGGPKELIARS